MHTNMDPLRRHFKKRLSTLLSVLPHWQVSAFELAEAIHEAEACRPEVRSLGVSGTKHKDLGAFAIRRVFFAGLTPVRQFRFRFLRCGGQGTATRQQWRTAGKDWARPQCFGIAPVYELHDISRKQVHGMTSKRSVNE